MLTDLDPRVSAHVNAHAVLGAIPALVDLAPDAQALLAGLRAPVVLRVVARGGPSLTLTFRSGGVAPGPDAAAQARRARRVTLLTVSPEHLNGVVAGTAQPVPVGGPAGLGFLTRVFVPMSALLARYLRPTPDDLADPAFARASTLLTLTVAVAAIAVVGNEDRSGRYSAAHMADGAVDLEVGDELRYRLVARDHHLVVDPSPTGPPRAALRFADLGVAGDVLTGRSSAMACICDGSLAMRGYIPLVDNVSRILDRAGHYLGE
ncbi:hypothetical protein [Cellulomonas oligotrophica]|uniref:SCP2 domain-containing protein n=1 Tax=Cellulomonas oligotrophica TaxID=931536 RepID=A0A7Y9FGY1_9CELL|nr:hypothetical protein [Cellulomonas oligotrophica]NYD86983.1 hypothetical protein [Cellulomonas oligotrophica]GIG32231.1 hypothetical protein Col01nite_13900 [Cellulomonas oligotrophica]